MAIISLKSNAGKNLPGFHLFVNPFVPSSGNLAKRQFRQSAFQIGEASDFAAGQLPILARLIAEIAAQEADGGHPGPLCPGHVSLRIIADVNRFRRLNTELPAADMEGEGMWFPVFASQVIGDHNGVDKRGNAQTCELPSLNVGMSVRDNPQSILVAQTLEHFCGFGRKRDPRRVAMKEDDQFRHPLRRKTESFGGIVEHPRPVPVKVQLIQ